ncbi:MAG: AI-2E family transporter [Helicobacter sp.]|nr:AI-2E family transporter [Helicobacter sp.]
MLKKSSISFIFLMLAILLSFLGILYLYQSFLLNFLIASLLCIATFGLKIKLQNRLHRLLGKSFSNIAASAIITGIFALFLFAPITFIFYHLLDFIRNDAHKFGEILNNLRDFALSFIWRIPFLQEQIGQSLHNIDISTLAQKSLELSSFFATKSINFVIDGLFIMTFMFILYFYGKQIYLYILRLVPFSLSISNAVFSEVSGVLKVVLFVSLINVILQGFAFFIAVYFLDLQNYMLLGMMYGILSLVPVVGGALVWLPLSLYLLYLGRIGEAIFIALYSIIFIAFLIDSIIKPFIIKLVTNRLIGHKLRLNEVFIFFAIFAGLGVFGFWGIIIGPALSSLFIALLHIYKRVLYNTNYDRQNKQT